MKTLTILLLIAFFQPVSAQKKNRSTSINGTVLYNQRIILFSLYTSTDTLRFNQKKSIFKWRLGKGNKIKSRRKSSGNSLSSSIQLNADDRIGRVNLYNTATDSMFSRTVQDKIYYLKAKRPHINWNITDSTKQIGNYTCTMASAHFRGRNYTAWFTPKIPVPYGPWKLQGLPGLILQVYDTKKEIYFTAKKISFDHSETIGDVPLDGHETVITLPEYKHIIRNEKKQTMRKYKRLVSKLDGNVNVSVEIKKMERFDKKDGKSNN